MGNRFHKDIHRRRRLGASHSISGSLLKEDKGTPCIPMSRVSEMIEAVDNALLGTFQDLNVNGLRIRSDNGSQLTLSGYEKHLRTLRIKHETIHAHTPEEDGHILH